MAISSMACILIVILAIAGVFCLCTGEGLNGIIFLCFAVLLAFIVFVFSLNPVDTANTTESSETSGTKWNGEQEIEKPQSEIGQIAIPGITGMYFDAGDTKQKVNIHNPESNTCDIKFTLIADGEAIWESEMTEPGYGYYDIELAKPLRAGTYKASLIHDCYRDDKKLNSANIDFNLEVK